MLNEVLPVLMRVTELGLTSLSTVTRWLGIGCELVSEASQKGSEHLDQMRLQHTNKASPKEEGHLSAIRGASKPRPLSEDELEALSEAYETQPDSGVMTMEPPCDWKKISGDYEECTVCGQPCMFDTSRPDCKLNPEDKL